jgi:hypothetical protein
VTDEQLLAQCKIALDIQTAETAFDNVLNQKLKAVKSFMIGAGVSTSMLGDDAAVEAVVLGVADIWNTESGEVKFSAVFNMLVTQLAAGSNVLSVTSSPVDGATGVSVSAEPVLTFNRPIDTYDIKLYVNSSKSLITIDTDLDLTEKVLTITPASNLAAATRYALVVESAVAVSGQSLERTVIMFTTA